MRAVRISDFDAYVKAIGILRRVGGTYEGGGTSDNRYLLISDEQYEALVGANVLETNGEKVENEGVKITARSTK